MRRALVTALIVSLASGFAVACSSDSGPQPTSTTSSSVAAPTTTSTTAAALSGASTAPVSTPDQGHTKLTGLTAANQGSFDRLTFTFAGGVPGYTVEYTTRPVQEDASGKTIEVNGDSVIRVRFAGASTVDLSGGKVTSTYTGPKRFSPSTAQITEVVEVGDFEDVLNWAVGVKGKPGFKVTVDSPASRILVDIQHLSG